MAGDIDLLISFKNSLPNPSLLSGWNPNQGPCSFRGVVCKEGLVSSLTLQGIALSPDFYLVSTYLLSLQTLEKRSLRSVNLTGNISVPPKCVEQLTELDLSSYNLHGSVFDAMSLSTSCPSLQSLNFSSNFIRVYPMEEDSPLIHPFPLKCLDLSNNKIEKNEDLQWALSGLGVLQMLDLSSNEITGSIPEFSNCTSLQHLDLSSNFLNDTVLAGTFSNCHSLTYLNLSSNQLTGTAPDRASCTHLTILSLSYNDFSGEVSTLSLTSMPDLKILEIGFNSFNGSLSRSMSKLTSLEILDLSSNGFSSSIPTSLCTKGVSNLKELYLQNNYFTGSIPDSLSNCAELVTLDISLNELNGSIPATLGTLSNLKDLIMWQNYLD
ncbi:hypothetical protein LUZ61_013962 [Rhynchospora tenuis]|uniref:Leucine-rich repeat-containing N-terminal plant-type domain-containing protein n=1 Tax=Rhynchospora tenuis TaxID=198213 RepID=A0AAD5WD92_9POAL|nr:hypothetical protein LUZ61_013962 [Rhynchospora tenuis]